MGTLELEAINPQRIDTWTSWHCIVRAVRWELTWASVARFRRATFFTRPYIDCQFS